MDELGTRVLREHGMHRAVTLLHCITAMMSFVVFFFWFPDCEFFRCNFMTPVAALSEAKELLRIAGASYSRALRSAPGNFDLLVRVNPSDDWLIQVLNPDLGIARAGEARCADGI